MSFWHVVWDISITETTNSTPFVYMLLVSNAYSESPSEARGLSQNDCGALHVFRRSFVESPSTQPKDSPSSGWSSPLTTYTHTLKSPSSELTEIFPS
jgi:hypothetical protein